MTGDRNRGLALIFHSGAYDRVQHGLSIALAALALGREVRIFFTYWSMDYLRREGSSTAQPSEGDGAHREILEEKIRKGHLGSITELLQETKAMGASLYACTNSMGILNIARDELIEAVDKPVGLTTFLAESSEDQLVFI